MKINEPIVSYGYTDDSTVLSIMNMIRTGVRFTEWSSYLHISERTMQRYQAENKTFEPLQSEKITQLTMLANYGTEVLGSSESFFKWVSSKNVALGGAMPKTFLDNSFGIEYIKNELGRIAHGVLA
ncbi:MAG: DUF2384 domain-containing protein [Bacteroidetes bacterium]|nr:MAG: DUF2384 domain-containing protein [Bacteroidota bacterium]